MIFCDIFETIVNFFKLLSLMQNLRSQNYTKKSSCFQKNQSDKTKRHFQD